MSEPPLDCSVIVCTRNRAESLRVTLQSLLEQDYDPERLEVLVEDNGSTDHTPQVVQECASGAKVPVRCLEEPRTGLSRARNAGMRAARGGILVFLDDDARPRSPGWLGRLVAAYRDPTVGAAGGDLVPLWPEEGRPAWIHDRLFPSLGLTVFGHAAPAETRYPDYPWGANVSYRKRSIEPLGGFSTELGRIGSEPFSGEETELCLRLELAGQRVLYVPDAVVVHDLRDKDLSPDAIQRYAGFQGISEARIERATFSRPRLLRAALRRVRMMTIGLVGSVLFSRGRAPAAWLLCRFRWHSTRAYFGALLRPEAPIVEP